MEYRLDELFDLQMGKTPARKNPEYWNSNDHKWISIADLSKCEKYITETKEHISSIAVQESGISEIPANTVIMSFKLSIGKTAITKEPIYSNEAIMSFRDKGVTPLLPDYIYYMFSGRDWSKGSNTAVMGTTLNKATLSQIRIYVHAYEDQKRIVELLDKVSSIISKRKQELVELDNLIKARFVEMFGSIHESTEYPYVAVKDLTNVISGGTPSRDKAEYWEDGTIPWVKTTELQNNIIVNVDEYITEAGLNGSSAKLVPVGTVLVAMYGQGKTRGMTAYLNIEACTNQACACILPSDKIDSMFMWEFFELSYEKLRSLAQGAGQPNLNGNMIKDFQVLVPPIELQKEYVDFVRQTDKSKLLSGCRLFHSWTPENRDKPKHVGVPQRKTKVLRGCRRQQ